jgi:UDP-N-acetylglucosamine--N-acetylmuramyl-(pentapeptide) pyrophosphoryl-undecaprenol N-acetylglucosamine transferase
MRVLIVTGSSGGHIFPAMALWEELKNQGQEAVLVLPKKSREGNIPVDPRQIKYIQAANLSLKLSSKNLIEFCLFLWGGWESLRLIVKFNPDVVVGFGSLNTIALIFWAWIFRKRTVIHEQNVVCGRANRLLSKLVDKVAVSFDQTRKYLNICPERIVLTGNPLRKEMVRVGKKEALDFFGLKDGKFTILVTGGSQGSHRLNDVCFETLSAYRKRIELQVIHISGVQDFGWLENRYKGTDLTFRIFSFLKEMQYAYSAADLVVCRAGATTISELGKFRIPAVLIPYPFAYAHQFSNARVLSELKAALIIDDRQLSVEKLSACFNELLADPLKLESMRQGYRKFSKQEAAGMLAKEVLNSV